MKNRENLSIADRLKLVLRVTVQELVTYPKEVKVSTSVSAGSTIITLTVQAAEGDVGKIIGKNGKNAKAIRCLLEAIAAKHKVRVVVEIDDSNQTRKHQIRR